MLLIVITFNCGIALLCLWVAGYLRRLRRQLRRATYALIAAERHTHRVLSQAPSAIGRGQQGTYQLRRQLALLAHRWQQLYQLYALLSLLQFGRRFQRSIGGSSR